MTGRRSHPTGSRRRFPAVLALLVLAGALLGVMGVGAGSAGAQSSAAADKGCSRVEVLLMIDQSASLRNTDPQDQRIAAAEVLLRSLAASAEAGSTTVEVTVAAFGTDAVEVGRATLPGGVTGAVDIVRPFADRETDLNTDYVLALGFAVRHFQGITDLPSECKRLVWFTDGAYSIDEPNAPGVAGYTTSTDRDVIVAELGGQICGDLPGTSLLPAPLAQQIRQAGFVVQLVDLRSGGTESEAERRDRRGHRAGDRPVAQRRRQRRRARCPVGGSRPPTPTPWPRSSSPRARSRWVARRSSAPRCRWGTRRRSCGPSRYVAPRRTRA